MTAYPQLKVGDVLEISPHPFGQIEPFIIRKIQPRGQGEYGYNNGIFLGLRPLTEKDKLVKSMRNKRIIYKLKDMSKA